MIRGAVYHVPHWHNGALAVSTLSGEYDLCECILYVREEKFMELYAAEDLEEAKELGQRFLYNKEYYYNTGDVKMMHTKNVTLLSDLSKVYHREEHEELS
jgi:hypothetical protein